MGEIVVSEIGKVRVEPGRRLMTEVVASAVALILAASALSVLKQEPSAPQAASMPPIVDRSTGKIVDRFGAKALADVAEPRPAVSSVALFAPGVDLGPALTTLVASAESRDPTAQPIQVVAQNATAQNATAQDAPAPAAGPPATAKPRATPQRAGARSVAVAEMAPLPPPRPDTLEVQTAAATTQVADVSAKEPSGLFGWRLPAEILPTGQKVLKQVASLSGAVLDRLTP